MNKRAIVGANIAILGLVNAIIFPGTVEAMSPAEGLYTKPCQCSHSGTVMSEGQVKSILAKYQRTQTGTDLPDCPEGCEEIEQNPGGQCCADLRCRTLSGTLYQVRVHIMQCPNGRRWYYCSTSFLRCCNNPDPGRSREGCENSETYCPPPEGGIPKCKKRPKPVPAPGTIPQS